MIYSVFIVNKAGSLIYSYDHNAPKVELEKTFSYPLELILKLVDERVVVSFGEGDGVKVGHCLLAVNGIPLTSGRTLADDSDLFAVINEEANYPISLKFGRAKLSTNEKIMLASMFHSLYAIGSQLSPVPGSSGIQLIETDVFRLHCHQTITGIKFIVITDIKQSGVDKLLKRMYEIYADFALKNPFYSMDMPIRFEMFDTNLQNLLEQVERTGISNV